MNKKILTFALTVFMTISMLCGCSLSSNKGSESNENTYASFPDKLTTDKINSISVAGKQIQVAEGGIYYQDENGKYGIISLNGKNDTGAIYTYCTAKDKYFMVTTEELSKELNIEKMNNVGVVDGEGKIIVPTEYASVDVLSEKYIKVCEATEKTDTKDEALVYYTDRAFALGANDDDTFFKGNWYVYDVETGEKLEGVTGTQAYPIYAYGNYITYHNDARTEISVNDKEEVLPDNAELFDNGSYAIDNDDNCAAYDTEGNKLFDYTKNDYRLWDVTDEGDFIARKENESNVTYMIINSKGEIISQEFENIPMAYGAYLLVDGKVVDFEGETVIEGDYEHVNIDKITKKAFMLETKDDEITIIKDNGEAIYKDKQSDDMYANSTYFTMSKKIDGKSMYYSLKDKDYTIEGASVSPWIIKSRGENNSASLVDTISGEILLNEYDNFQIVYENGYYVYAQKEDTVDIYIIK